MKAPELLFTIDPGIGRTGWSFWVRGKPKEWGLVTGKDIETTSWKTKAHIVAERTADRAWTLLGTSGYGTKIVCEMPMEMGGGAGRGAKALQGGAIRKLTLLVGLVAGRLSYRYGRQSIVLVEPLKWKGQVPKEITAKRIHKHYPQTKVEDDHNVLDALGIGHWYLYKRADGEV